MAAAWHAPLDPHCPLVAAHLRGQADDPIWQAAGIAEEWWEDFAAQHRRSCTRCRLYGAANMELSDTHR